MKKRVLFLITLMFVLFNVNSLFAQRDINLSQITTSFSSYTPGASYNLDFQLDVTDLLLTGDVVTDVDINFPPGVTVNATGTTSSLVDMWDFLEPAPLSPTPIGLDFAGQTGDGVNCTWSIVGVFNGPGDIVPGPDVFLGPGGAMGGLGLPITVSPGFTGAIVINWAITSVGTGGGSNYEIGQIVVGPPYGLDQINIIGTGGAPSGNDYGGGYGDIFIIADCFDIEVFTVGKADSMFMDLSQFGGPADLQLTMDVSDTLLWVGSYCIEDCTSPLVNCVDGLATASATGWWPGPVSAIQADDDTYPVDNQPPLIGSWGYFTNLDQINPPDSNEVADFNFGDGAGPDNDDVTYHPGTESTGDGIVWFVEATGEFADDFDSSVLLTQGTVNGTLNWLIWDPEIEVSDNAGNSVVGHAVNPDSLVFVDNDIPTEPDTSYFEIGDGPSTRGIQYAGIGDTIRAVVDITSLQPIVSGNFDFSALDPGPPPDANYQIPGIIDGNLIYAEYVVQSGDTEILTPPGLIVYATLVDSAGNFSDPPIEIGGTTGDSLYVDGTPPVAVTDISHTGYLRFSPDTDSTLADYSMLTNRPDSLVLQITLDQWGEIGGPDEFTVRIEQENLASSRDGNPRAFKTYQIGDDDVWVESVYSRAPFYVVYFYWDGVIPADTDFGVPGEIAPEGTYGFSLWSLKDGADNEGVMGHVPDVEDVDPPNGIFLLNAEHGVVDDTPPEYDNELDVFGTDDTSVSTIYRWINDTNYNNSLDVGDALLEVDSVYFKFDVTRLWEENDNRLRDETVTYWIELEGPDSTKYRYFLGDEDSQGPTTTPNYGDPLGSFVEYTTEDSVVFGTFNEINSTVGAGKDIMWVPDLLGGIADLTFPAGTYHVTAKVRDNAGNIRDGLPTRATVELVDMLYAAPIPDSLVITSEHTCPDTNSLPAFDLNMNQNFYVDASFDTLRDEYYYNSPDVIDVYLRLASIAYVDSVVIENLYPIVTHGPTRADIINGQLPNQVFLPGDFGPGNDLTFSYNVAGIDETAAWDSTYTVGYLNTGYAGLAFQVRVYDSYYGGEINFGAALSDSFNLVRPEQPVWPGTGEFAVDLTLSDDRFSPGWYTLTYDAQDNPARDNEQDTVSVELAFSFAENTTRDFNWFIAIDTMAIDQASRAAFSAARFSRTGTELLGDDEYNIYGDLLAGDASEDDLDFYGLQNNITLEPLINELQTGKLIVSAFAIADGYEDCGYVLPPGLFETITYDTLWVDNENPRIYPIDNPIKYGWLGDDNYWGHLYENVEDERAVAYDDTTFTLQFRTNEPFDDTIGDWTVLVVDVEGNDLFSVGTGNPQIGAMIVDLVGSNMQTIDEVTGYTEFWMEVEITNLDPDDEYLDAALVIMAPTDGAGNPAYTNDPHYPYDIVPPYHAGSDAYRWDSSEAYVRFMILNDIPHIEWMQYTYAGSTGEYDRDDTDYQGYIGNNGVPNIFSFLSDISGVVYEPLVVGDITRDISTTYDVDFSLMDFTGAPQDLVTIEADPDMLSLQDALTGFWWVDWYSREFTDISAPIVDGSTVYVDLTLKLNFTDTDFDHFYEETVRLPLIIDTEDPYIDLQQPVEVVTRTPDMLEGTSYRIDAIVNDNLAGLNFPSAQLTCLQDTSIAFMEPTSIPFELRNDDGFPLGGWIFYGNAGLPLMSGTKFLYQAEITEIAWVLPGMLGNTTVDLYIVELDENGEPDMTAGNLMIPGVAHAPDVWNTYSLTTPYTSGNGVLVGVSESINDTTVFYYDDGLDAPFEYVPNTAYVGIPGANLFQNLDSDYPGSNFIRINTNSATPWSEPIVIREDGDESVGEAISLENIRNINLGVPLYDQERAGVISWFIDIPEEYPIRILDFEASIEDIVLNISTDTETWDIGNVPVVWVDDFFNVTHPLAPYYITDGDDADLYITVQDTERVELINIVLNTDFVYPIASRIQYLEGDTLTFTLEEFLALTDFEPEVERAVILGQAHKIIHLGSLNALGTRLECEDVDAWVEITHDYDHTEDASYANSVALQGLTIDNTAPVIENMIYTLTEVVENETATVLFEADIYDPLMPDCAVGLYEIFLYIDGINGSAVGIAPDGPPVGDTFTWTLAWPTDFIANGWDLADLLQGGLPIDGEIYITANDLLLHDSMNNLVVDELPPTVDDVTFWVNGLESNVIFPDDTINGFGDVWIDVTVTSTEEHVLYGIPDRVYVEYDGNLMGTFDSGDPVLLPAARTTDSYTFRFYDVTFSGFEVPYEGFDIADFTVYAITMYNGRSADYQKQMIVVDYPREDLYGILDVRAQGVYAGVDPSGWFAPEHNIQGTMTFVSPTSLDTDHVIGNFDYVGDFVEPWINPDRVITTDTDNVVLMEGTPWEVTVPIYTQDAEWDEIITDAQSIWNLILPTEVNDSPNDLLSTMPVTYPNPTFVGGQDIQDGFHTPIPIVAWQLGYELPWVPFIQVDMNDPGYSSDSGNTFYFEEIDRTLLPSFDLYIYRIEDDEPVRAPVLVPFSPGSNWNAATKTYTLEVPFEDLPFTDDIVLKTIASDWTPQPEYPSVGGAGVLRIDTPTTAGLLDINPYGDDEFGYWANNISGQPGDSTYYANWILSPLGGGFVHGDEVTIQLGQVWDEVGHNEGYAPEITIVFSAQYQGVNTDELLIYDYKGFEPGGDPENPETAPYVRADDRFGIQVPVIPFDRNTAIANVKAFTGMLENDVTSTEEADSLYDVPFYWVTLTQSADFINNNLYYLNQQVGRSIKIDSSYVDGDILYTKIRINYANGSVQETGWITARTENYAIVDGVDPFIQEYGIEIWSETLEGPDVGGEEGYVMPGDIDGHLRITFEDNLMPDDYDLGAVPMLEVFGLNLFVTSRQVDGFDVPMVSPYYMPVDSYDAQRGVWIAEIDSMLINCLAPVAEQHVIEVNLWDPVGNDYAGNPASKFVEVTEDGPIVPVIRGIAIEAGDFPNPVFQADNTCPHDEDMMVEVWPGVDFNSAAVGPDATITFKVYVRAQFEAYIEGLWLDLSDLGGPAEAYIPHADIVALPSAPENNLWVGTYVLDGPSYDRGDVIDITAYTIRHPFDAFDVFNDNFTVQLNIDEDDVNIIDTMVSTNYPTVEWVINPDATVDIWATFTDLLGEFGDSLAWIEATNRYPVDVHNWFSVENNGVDNFFDAIGPIYPDDVQLVVDEDAAICHWFFDSSDLHIDMVGTILNPSIYEGTEDQFVNILFNARNIYNETFTWDSDPIRVDDLAPRFNGDTYTYGENHEPNRTIVPYYNDGSVWDADAKMHLVYDDVTGIYQMWTDWSEFGGTDFNTPPDVVRSTEEFTFPFGTNIYDPTNIPENPYDTDNVSWNDFVSLTLTDNVFNLSDTNFVNTTFVFREDDDYESFEVTMYPNDNFVNQGGYWYTINPYMEFYVEHNVMGYDNIDNDVMLPFDAMHEGILFDPLYLEVNHHVYNNWYPFPHEFHMVNDTMVISMEGQYELLTDGVYDLEVHTENIFNHQIMGNLRFSVDNRAPIVTAFAFDGGNDFDMNDVVIVYSDWDEISIRFRDPIITGSAALPGGAVPGVGVDRDTTFTNTWAQLFNGQDTSGDQVTEIVPLEWSGGRLILGVDDRWAGDNLEPGYYTLLFHVSDLLGNSEEYTKTFFYNHQEPEVELHVFDHNYEEISASDILDISDEIAFMGATVNDEFGMVTGVSFELWFDEDGDEVLSGDDVQYSELPDDPMDHLTSIEGMPDPSVPFEATWHILDWEYLYDIVSGTRDAAAVMEHVNAYNYRHDETIFNTDTRYWFIVTTVTSNSGQSVQDTTKWMVRDDVGPAPMLTGMTNYMNEDIVVNSVHYDYTLGYDFDYNNFFLNTSTLRAICQYDSDGDGLIDTNWPDAWKVDFIIEGPNDYSTEITDTYMQPALPNQPGYYTGFWDWSQLALDNPGMYTITARGWDRVSNSEMSLNSFDVLIYTQSTAYGDLSMWNFDLPEWDDAVIIPDGSEYGPYDPIENIINLRLDVTIFEVDEILEAGLFYNIYDNVAGEYVSVGLPLPNDTDINPDFPALLDHIYPQEMNINGTTGSFRVVIPEDVYMGPDYLMNDYSYEFELWLTDFAGIVHDPANLHVDIGNRDDDPIESIRVDYVAPEAYMMDVAEVLQGDAVDDATVVVPQEGNAADEWIDGYDLGGDHSLVFKWSYDGIDWTYFIGEGSITENETVPTREYWYNNWDTRVLDALDVYNFEGWVYITAEVQDMRGNWADAVPTMVYVDNQAPSVPITEVAYRSLPGNDFEDPSLYLDWHDLGFLLGEADNTITCVYNPQSTEDALLRMRVHQSEIENLSYYNIPPGADSDLAMPVTLLWQQGDQIRPYGAPVELAYDHEIDPDGWFHFEVLLGDRDFSADATHYFAFVANDVFGNVEGDQPVFDGMVDSDEYADMWDLRVNIVNDEPVVTSIIQPPHPFMSEIVNIGAVVDENLASKPIDYFTYQVSPDGHTWSDIAMEEYEGWGDRGDGVEDFTFHIYRHEIPWYNDWPYIPGIHIWTWVGDEYQEVADMNNIYVDDPFGDFDPDDGPMGGWTKTVELPVGWYGTFDFYLDQNDDGVAGPGDPVIHDHEYHGIEVLENMVPFDCREMRLVDGLYYFRAVPHTPEFDARGAQLAEYQIDNTPPTLLLDIVGNDEEMPTFSYFNDSVELVTDVDDLLVYPADFLVVEYQYSVEAPGTEFRQWFTFAASNVLPGDFGTILDLDGQTAHPMHDNIDNDGDGLVDEADEANAYFYIRTWSHDPAGNFSYSNEEMILVDGSEPYLHITSIGGQVQSGPEWVVNIPEDGLIELIATDITPDYLDDAVLADFYYRPTHDSEYMLIEEGLPVVDGVATCIWDINEQEPEREPGIILEEGYYTLMVIGWDRVMNDTDQGNPLFVETTFILNDATGPEAYISSVGTSTKVEETNFFGNAADYNDESVVTVMITNPEDVATVTLEYSIDGVVYHNIDTQDYDGGGSREDYVTFDWDLPYEEDMTYYLRAFVEDYEANDNVPEVMFYYDNTDPVLAGDPGITTLIDLEVWGGELVESVLDYRADSVRTTLEYAVDEFHGLNDVAFAMVELLPILHVRTGYTLGIDNYTVSGVTGDNFIFDMNDDNAVSDEYYLLVTLTDFAGNTAMYSYYYIVIDNTAPDFEADELVHITGDYQTEWYDVSDGNAIQFMFPAGEEDDRYVNWWDSGVRPESDMFLGVETVEMRLYADEMEEFVNGVIDSLGNIYFSWIPNALAGHLYEPISIEITMTDFYNNATTNQCNNIMLYDTNVTKARILEVQDNMVDWQDEEQADVWVTGHWAMIDAYVPDSFDMAYNVLFEWFDPVLEDWVLLGVDSEGVYMSDPPYEYPNSYLYQWNWDMTELENGDHLIKATAIDRAGLADDDPWIVTVHKNDMQDYPVVYVWDGDMAAAELVRGGYYNLTATSDYPEAFNDLTFKYRYTDEEGEWPADEWFVIGADADGEVPLYLNNWLIHNTMVPGLEIQIIAIADYLGGGTRYDQPNEQDIFDMGLYVQLPIVDVTPPEILDITFNVEEEQQGDRALVPYWPYVNNTETTHIDTIMAWIAAEYFELDGEYIEDMNDLHRIYLSYTDMEQRTTHLLEEVWFTDEAATNPYEYMYTNYGMGWDISEFENGEFSVDLQVWDTADNTASISIPFYIDTVAPTSALTITDLDGNEVTYLQRGETYLLTANAADNMMVAAYAYEYTVDGGNAIALPLEPDTEYGETIEFTVPEDINYGSELEFTVYVTDMVGLQAEPSSVTRFVFDSETLEMLITHVGGNPYVPNMHINGEVGLNVLLLGNTEPDLVVNVALKYRYAEGTDWILIDDDDPVVPVTGINNDAAYDVWDVEDLAEGWVEVGVVPVSDPENIWEEPLYWATLYIDHTPPALAVPDVLIPSCINGDVIRIEFAELPADLNHTTARFEFAVADQAGIEEAWMTIDEQPDFGFDGGFWFFELVCDDDDRCYMDDAGFINSEVYDFRLHFEDVAVPEPNTAKLNEIEEVDGGTLFDNVAPVVFVSQIDDIVRPQGGFDEPVEIVLSTTPVFTAMAFEHPDEYPLACGVEMVEFYIEDFLIDVDYEEPFSTNVWNTTGVPIGEYELTVIGYDGAGNWAEDIVEIAIVPVMDPYAVIVGFDFDYEVENHDHLYAVTRDCQDRETVEVWFEYLNDDEWIPFTFATSPMNDEDENGMELWIGSFNADNMITSAIRAVAYYENSQGDLVRSSIEPELAVQYYYTPEQGGIFDLAEGNTNEDVRFFYRDIVHATIQPGERVPFLMGMNEVDDNNDQDTEVELLIPHQLADDEFTFEALTCQNGAGVNILNFMDDEFGNTLTMWSASVDPLNGYAINLNRAIIDVHPISGQGGLGTMTSEDGVMDVTIPANGGPGHMYFEPVLEDDYIPVEMPFVPISRQEVIRGDLGQNHSLSTFNFYFVDGTAQIDPNVPVYMAWTHGQGQGGDDHEHREPWMFSWDVIVPAEFIYDGGDIIGATFEFGIETGFYTLVQNYDFAPELEYVTVSNEWWDPDNLWTSYDWDFYCDGPSGREPLHIDEGINFSFRTFVLENDGQYEVDPSAIIDVYLNGIRIVNNGVPDPEYVGMPLEIDPVSGIFHVLLVNQEYLEDHNEGLGHELEVYVDVLGYTNSTDIVFNVDSSEPLIQNDGGGYVRHEMTIWANIWDPETDIDTEWMELILFNPEDWNDPDEYIIVPYAGLDVTWDEQNQWYHVEYTITLDDLTTCLLGTADVNEVYAMWWAMNNVNIETPYEEGYNVVPYIVDIAPPIVWAISPVGAPLDNDGDGLFNEDPINGINDDLDFDDWNNNGVQDGMWVSDSTGTYWVGEPSIIDEDPIDFHPDTLLYGQPVVVAIGYEDIPMPIVVGDEDCGDCTIYSGASGVDIENIIVTLNGIELTDEMGTLTITEGTWQFAPDELLIPGHYVVIASVYDIAGNVGSVSYEFEILGVAPTIAFIEPEAGWWLNPHDASTLQFTVDTMEGCPIAFDGVMATVYAGEDIIFGPTVISPDEYDIYNVVVNAGIIDSDLDAVTLSVTATTIFGDSSDGAQAYGVDSEAPTAQFTSPDDGEVFGLENAIHVIATYSDIENVGRKDSKGPLANSKVDEIRGNGSGISSARLFITPPDGETEIYSGSIDGYVETVIEPQNLQVGEYTAMLEVIDNVLNLTNININFTVESPAPSITFYPFENGGGWWFNPSNNLEPFEFDVHAGAGVAIAEDGVVVTFYGVPGMEVLQGPQTLPYNENGEYAVNLGANVPSYYTGVILEVQATNIYGSSTTSSQTYGVDTESPTVEFISPADDAQFSLSAIVNVLINYTDTTEDMALGRNEGTVSKVSSEATRSYGSGIMSANLRVLDPMGMTVVNVNAGMDTHTLEAVVNELQVGTYTAIATVTDKANNSTVKSIEFHVYDVSLGIEFFSLGHSGWWYGPHLNVPLTFQVTGNVGENGVVVNLYGMPGNELLQGPQYVYESNGIYSVWVAADVTEYDAMILEVSATNVSGQTTMANQTYSIDIEAPIVSISSPVDGAEFDAGNAVEIRAYYSDGESGISNVVLKVDGAIISDSMMTMSLASLLYVNEYALGEHNIELMVTDHVMNVTTMVWSFFVTDTNIDLIVTDIQVMNNPIDFANGETLELLVDVNKTANVKVILYDFAGKEVMTTEADNRGVISWNCRRGGIQIARGVYFARVIITDGRSQIEKIIKIAVK